MPRPTPPDLLLLPKNNSNSSSSSNDNQYLATAYLRIRLPPSMHHEKGRYYLKVVAVSRFRYNTIKGYKFSSIITENVKQKEFFDKTILPLVEDYLKGENALVFAYGVTNSGNTYTVMGTKEEIGLVPQTLDIIFNCGQGSLNESKIKPTMNSLVETYHDPAEEN
ncbi:hypothetical protein O0I10_011233 [Lichtheimia ornata]|uniref:Kinesin motor domain-containing protein n=1 Tax=Lichtheimia ornata TaxID=688661 RepID=A0AAD7XWX3_9FUNG|nr:uncharacterized protein O0I10_011233 [Lichtheimia ornata]KAJ8653092.1 hypothetical protein O0I10_011233 [Lichtheimia ornata]